MTEETLTHAVTRPQPYAWSIAAGHCPIINATTRPGLEHIGKLVGIHAGLQRYYPGTAEWEGFSVALRSAGAAGGRMPETWTSGALVGVARLVGVVRRIVASPTNDCFELMSGRSVGVVVKAALAERLRPWWRGPWGWLFEEAVLLPEPIPLRGQQGLWRNPEIVPIDGTNILVRQWALEQWRKARAAA